MRQHAVGRRARRRHDRVRQGRAARLPAARGLHHDRRVPRPSHVGRRAAALGGRAHRRRDPQARRVRARHDLVDGVLGLLPHRVGPHRLRQGPRHPGGPGPRIGGRMRRGVLPAHHRARPDPLRPPVRAVPQPEPRVDARHRHGLRLPLPGRDDPLRVREVRARPRRPDHHVRHDQGAQRRSRRGARARHAVRGRRQDRQGHAAARDGPRHAAQVLLRTQRQVRRRVQGGVRPAGDVRQRSRGEEGRRRRQGARGPEAVRRHPRRRGRDHEGTAHHLSARFSASRRAARTPTTRRSSRSTKCTGSRTSGC